MYPNENKGKVCELKLCTKYLHVFFNEWIKQNTDTHTHILRLLFFLLLSFAGRKKSRFFDNFLPSFLCILLFVPMERSWRENISDGNRKVIRKHTSPNSFIANIRCVCVHTAALSNCNYILRGTRHNLPDSVPKIVYAFIMIHAASEGDDFVMYALLINQF